MVASDSRRDALEYPIPATVGWIAGWSGAALALRLPMLIGGAVVLGTALLVALTPIGSGDYGQWLMTSRAVLGLSVPEYRDLTAVPPIVPFLIAIIRIGISDEMATVHAAAVILALGLGTALYALGAVVGRSHWTGALAVVFGFLVTDRFTELFAFGGLLQVGALIFGMLSVAAFVRAAGTDTVQLRLWWMGVAALALAALSHVGTSIIVVPIGILVAGSALIARWDRDFPTVLRQVRLPLLGLVVIGAFWLIVLRMASYDFIDNPASLGYRGPGRLWELLLGRWPTALVLIVGGGTILLGTISAVIRRRVDGFVALAAWSIMSWAALAYAIASGSATDYPRLATPLLVPLVIATAVAAHWAIGTLAASASELGLGSRANRLLPVVVMTLVLAVTPFATERFGRQASFYALRDAQALVAAADWLGERVGDRETVLADAREAKWIEGLTGLPTLFSQSVRYAFRSDEWQRSAAADALLRSSETVTTGLVSAQFGGIVGAEEMAAPSRLTLAFNHGGEMVEMLRMTPEATTLSAAGTSITAEDLEPAGTTRRLSERQAQVIARWAGPAGTVAYSQTVIAWQDGSTIRVVLRAPGHQLSTVLGISTGLAITSTATDPEDSSLVACFTRIGFAEPCVRIRATQDDAQVTSADGSIEIRTTRSDRIDLLLTALTPGDPAVALQLLDPRQIVESYDVGAALLYAADPAYVSRVARLESLGFREGPQFGPYRVLTREAEGSP